MIQLDDHTRRAIARHGGSAVRRPLMRPIPIEQHRGISGGCGVYVVCDLQDVVIYVGSAHRPAHPRGLSRRIGEHLADPLKALRWRRVWALIVAEGCGRTWIRDYEAVVGAELAPTWNERLPALIRV